MLSCQTRDLSPFTDETSEAPQASVVAQSCSTAREVEMWSQCYPAPKEPSGFLHLRGGSLSTQKNRLLKATENIKFEKRTDMGFRA